MFKDIGILGTGLWDGPVITNEMIVVKSRYPTLVPTDGDSVDRPIRVAGLPLSPDRHPLTVAEIKRCRTDPYRGSRRRRILPIGAKVSDAEVEAARNALADANLDSSDVDVLLVHSLLPDHLQPKNAALIAHRLGIRRGPAWDVDAMCTSSLAHMAIGAALIASGQARHVLCVQSTDCSKVTDPDSLVMGDMASAFVLGPLTGCSLTMQWCNDGKYYPMVQLRRTTAPYWAASDEPMEVRIDDDLAGPYLQATAHNTALCHEALHRAALRIDEIDLAITHQTTHWYPAFIADSLGLRDGVMFHTFEEYGNVNACCIPASLHEARRAGRCGPGSKILLYVPAAGQVCGAIALRC